MWVGGACRAAQLLGPWGWSSGINSTVSAGRALGWSRPCPGRGAGGWTPWSQGVDRGHAGQPPSQAHSGCLHQAALGSPLPLDPAPFPGSSPTPGLPGQGHQTGPRGRGLRPGGGWMAVPLASRLPVATIQAGFFSPLLLPKDPAPQDWPLWVGGWGFLGQPCSACPPGPSVRCLPLPSTPVKGPLKARPGEGSALERALESCPLHRLPCCCPLLGPACTCCSFGQEA